jgi:hypothetical protein
MQCSQRVARQFSARRFSARRFSARTFQSTDVLAQGRFSADFLFSHKTYLKIMKQMLSIK